jgi:hypothetical protein
MSMDPSGANRLDAIEAKLQAIAEAIVRLELIGSARLEELAQEGRERFNGIDSSLLGVIEALQMIATKMDE